MDDHRSTTVLPNLELPLVDANRGQRSGGVAARWKLGHEMAILVEMKLEDGAAQRQVLRHEAAEQIPSGQVGPHVADLRPRLLVGSRLRFVELQVAERAAPQ